MASSCIAATLADVRVARTRPPMPIQKLVAKRSCRPIKNAAVSVVSPVPSGFLAPPCPVGSKKSSSASSFVYHSARPGPRSSHVHDIGTGRTVVVCAQKSQRLLDLDCPLSKEPASGRLRGWGSQQKDVSAVVGGHSRGISPRTLLHGFLGDLRGGDPRGAAHGSGKRDGRNGPRGAVEQHVAAASGPFCAHDIVLFQVCGDARGVSSALSPSLQSRPGYPSQMSHYRIMEHDSYNSYPQYTQCVHALCNAHPLRELRFFSEHEKQKWAEQLKKHLLACLTQVEEARVKGETHLQGVTVFCGASAREECNEEH